MASDTLPYDPGTLSLRTERALSRLHTVRFFIDSGHVSILLELMQEAAQQAYGIHSLPRS